MPFKNIFTSSSSSSSLNEDNVIKSTSSHRTILKQRDTSSLLASPQSTSSRLNNNNNNINYNHPRNSNNNNINTDHPMHIAPSINSNMSQSSLSTAGTTGTTTINNNNNSTTTHSPTSTKSHRGPSLRRFFKKFKPRDHHDKLLSSHQQQQQQQHHHHHYEKQKHFGAGKPAPINSNATNLFAKYGSPGKLLGTGASGSVNLLTSKNDPTKIYAVKKFRARMTNEQESDYKIKVANEFKVGEMLQHENIIKTFELIKDYSNTTKQIIDPDYYIIMEYCQYDFFNLVMSGLMETKEIYCYFKQIINGVAYLHSKGLAHRDLKLDNCVVNKFGILKLIDFGSAVHFRKEIPKGYYITSDDIMLAPNYKLIRARGVVGSDPYLSPEVFEPLGMGYDPRGADVWSIAIIYCCMILKRFPWKLPKLSDPSYRSFAGPQLNNHNHHHNNNNNTTTITSTNSNNDVNGGLVNDVNGLSINNNNNNSHSSNDYDRNTNYQSLVGPERLLRLLPIESRDLIKNMLILDPKKRYYMPDVIQDPFVNNIHHCYTLVDVDQIIPSQDHVHHLVTEEDLNKLTQERERVKRLKDAGMA